MTRLYLKEKWSNPLPPLVVLPTKEVMKKLWDGILIVQGELGEIPVKQLSEYHFSKIAEEIMNSLTYRDTAILTLEYECLGLAKELLEESEWVTDLSTDIPVIFSNMVLEAGKAIFGLLEEIHAYHGGNLAYQYSERDGFDIILMHRDYRPFGLATEDIVDRLLMSSVAWRY